MNPVPFYYRPLFIVSVALGLSALINVALLVHAGKQWGEAKAEAKLDIAEKELAAAKQSMAISGALAKITMQDRAVVLDELAGIAKRARQTRVIYKNAAAAAPLDASCAPGIGRMQAVNTALGPGDKP